MKIGLQICVKVFIRGCYYVIELREMLLLMSYYIYLEIYCLSFTYGEYSSLTRINNVYFER